MKTRSTIRNPEIEVLLKEGRVGEALEQPLSPRLEKDKLKDWFATAATGDAIKEAVAYGGLTLGDLVYDYSRINPDVIRSIDFASVEDFDSLFSFSRFAQAQLDRGAPSVEGVLGRLQGYVAEGVVASNLEARGHDIELANVSNQEGWDLLVDGEPFQVKCVESSQSVLDHLERYPEVPVIVNRELADTVGELPSVYIDSQLSHSAVRMATEQSLSSGREVLEFEIPWIALTVSSAFGIRDLIYGRSDLSGVITNVLTDTTGRIVCGEIGQLAGTVIGLTLFGPAGGVIGPGLGVVAGAGFGGKPIARAARRWLTRSEEEAVRAAIVQLADEAEAAMEPKLDAWRHKRTRIESTSTSGAPERKALVSYLLRRIDDDIVYFENKREEIARTAVDPGRHQDPIEAGTKLLTTVQRAAIHAKKTQTGLKSVLESFERLAKARKRLLLG